MHSIMTPVFPTHPLVYPCVTSLYHEGLWYNLHLYPDHHAVITCQQSFARSITSVLK